MLGSLVSAAGSLIGGLFGQNSQEKQDKINYQRQKEFAQNSVQWRAADAEKAGIHPLYAMGAPTMSYQSSVGDSPLANGLASASQDIGRAVDAGMTVPEKATEYTKTLQGLQLQRAGLENELLASQIAQLRAPAHPPAFPASGAASGDPIVIAGSEIARHSGYSDANVIQNRYGEPAEYFYFPFVAGADAMKHFNPRGAGALRGPSVDDPAVNSYLRSVGKYLGY